MFENKDKKTSENNIKKMIKNIFNDPVGIILQKNSVLTNIQYESLIIEHYIQNVFDNTITFDNMTVFRTKKVSRGSFSRTLSQARKNIISSIYTIILLSYIGIFDTIPFDDYRNIAEKLSEYTLIIKDPDNPNKRSMINRIEKELMEGIKSLSKPKRLSQGVISH